MVTQTIAPTREIDLTRYPKQEEFIADPSDYLLWAGGRSSGKTISGTLKLYFYLLDNPGARALVLAPTYSQLKSGTMITFFEWFPQEFIARFNRSQDELYIDTTNGCRIYFRNSLRPDMYRSMETAVAWLDEAAYMDPEVRKQVIATRRQKDPRGRPYPYQMWFTTTPKGQNWVYQDLINPATRVVPNTAIYFSDSRDNPWNSDQYLDSLLREFEGIWREQEVEGKFITFSGLVYPEFRYQSHVVPAPNSFKQVFCGLDPGVSEATSMHLYGRTEEGRYWSFREYYRRSAPENDYLYLLSEWQREFPALIVCPDPRAKVLRDTLRARGFRLFDKVHPWEDGVRLVRLRLTADTTGRPSLFFDPCCVEQIAEIQSYCLDDKLSLGAHSLYDRIKPRQPDHAMDDMRYALMGESTRTRPHNIVGFRWGG